MDVSFFTSCTVLAEGCRLYEDNMGLTPVVDGYYSDYTDCFQVVNGVIIAVSSCTPTPLNCSFIVTAEEITTPCVTCCDVTIGTQIWTRCNLNVDTYRDGTEIPQAANSAQWNTAQTGLWTYYAFNSANGPIYGKLYNWYAVMGIWQIEEYPPTPEELAARKPIAPAGYHVPSDAEWTTLTNYLNVQLPAGNIGGKMKEAGTVHWDSPNVGATNSSAFTGLPGGYRDFDGDFNFSIGGQGLWWSSTEFVDTEGDSFSAWRYYLQTGQSYIARAAAGKNLGFSIRLIKD